MAHRRILTMAASLVLLVTALAGGQGTPFPDAQAATFIGTWAFTMTEPEAFKGSQQIVRIWEKNGVIGASIQIGKFPAIEATGSFKDGDMLVLTISHASPTCRHAARPVEWFQIRRNALRAEFG